MPPSLNPPSTIPSNAGFWSALKSSAPSPQPTGNFWSSPKSPAATPIPAPQPAAQPSPNPAAAAAPSIPASALKGNLGGGYGTSNITDPASGKPLLTYENPQAKQSQLLTDRTVPSFDPTVPQKIDPATLQNPRMKEQVSQAIKQAVGGNAFEELDHIMPLELGGSNNTTNLRLEKGQNPNQPYSPSKNPTPTDPLENQLADQVHSGQISLLDGWKAMAKAKGITLPEDGGPNPANNTIQQSTQPQSPLQKLASTITHPFAFSSPEDFAQKFPGLTQTLADLQTNPLSLGSSVTEILKTPFTDALQASDAFNATLANFINGLKSHAPASEDINNGLQTATSFAQGMLTPLTTWFNVANKIPIVGTISKLLFNVPFATLGDVSGKTGVQALASLSKSNGGPIPDQAVQNLIPGVQAISTLAGQIIAGRYVAPDVLETLRTTFGPTDAQTILSKAQELAHDRVESPEQPQSPAQQPTPATNNTQSSTPKNETSPPTTQPITEKVPALQPIERTAETKTTGLAQSVEQRAIQDKLTRGFGDLPQYQTVNWKNEATWITNLISTDYDQAKRYALGLDTPPDGHLPVTAFTAVEEKAFKDGDASTIRDLATQSTITPDISRAAQSLGYLANRDPESPVEAIKDLQSAREDAATKKLPKGTTLDKAKSDIADQIKQEIKKAAPTKQNWADFVKSIQC